MLKQVIAFLFFLICNGALGQVISGKIVEKGSDTPLAGAHIYILNSLQGNVSNEQGEFSINPTNAYGELLITYVGYLPQKVKFSLTKQYFNVELVTDINQLEEVSVNSTTDKKWKRLYKKFETSFLGNTKNAKDCEILNPWVVNVYKDENGALLAKSSKPIQIINNALGYKLTFYLTDFLLKSERLHYQGFVYFDSLKELDANEKQGWVINRKETFLGSKRHFLMALGANDLQNAGYELYDAEFSPGIGFVSKNTQIEKQKLKNDSTLIISDYLKIVFKNQPPQKAFISNAQSQASVDFQGPKADLVPKGTMQMSTQGTSKQVS